MENQLNEKEKITKKIISNNKNKIIKKRISLLSLDKFKDVYYSNLAKKNDNNKNNAISEKKKNKKDKNIDNNNKSDQNKLKLRKLGETIHKRKIIDYILLSKKNSNRKNFKSKEAEAKQNNYINNIYKENCENKKRLEEFINDFSLKKKMIDNKNFYKSNNNTIQQKNKNENKYNNISTYNNVEMNAVKRDINKELKEGNNNSLNSDIRSSNYHKKRSFYALDCKIYYKNNNIEKYTPFKNKMLLNKQSFSKKLKISNSKISEKTPDTSKNRNSFRIDLINLTYNNTGIINYKEDIESISSIKNNENNNIYIPSDRNNIINYKKDNAQTNYEKEKEKEKKDTMICKNFMNNNKLFKKDINIDENENYRKIEVFNNINDENLYKNSRNIKKGVERKHRSFNRHSFNFLVNQTNRNRELSISFNRRYKLKKPINNNNAALTNDSLSYSNFYNETDTNVEQETNKSSSILYYGNFHHDKRYYFEKDKKNMKINNSHKFFVSKEDLINNKNKKTKENNSIENKTPYYNRVISDNYIEFTPTSISNTKETSSNNNDDKNYVIHSVNKKNGVIVPKMRRITKMEIKAPDYKLLSSKISNSYRTLQKNNNLDSINNLNKEKEKDKEEKDTSSSISLPSSNSNFCSFINLELLYFLEEKMRNVKEKMKNYEKCVEECHLFINYYFIHNFYIEELRVFKINQNREFMINYLKMELLCYFLLYNISLGEKFNESKILLKTIFEILYNNFLLFLSLIISQTQNKESNVIVVLNKTVKDNLDINKLKNIYYDFSNLDENKYIEIILITSKNIDDYYKMIINNIYIDNINEGNYINFTDSININPNELDKNKKENIKESFFIKSYKNLTHFNFDIFKKFYYTFLCSNEIENNSDSNLIEEKINNNDIKEKKEIKYLLPEIKDNKKYSLILDLDETLIYAQRSFSLKFKKSENNINKKRIILRPCLSEFLHEMKQIFELIVFSSGTPEYVDPIIKIIEKNEKYFDHILYRHHISLDDNGNNVKNLDIIGRDLKNIIIIDDIPRYFHLQKRNGINIKPFCGNILSDTKTLKTLNNVLKKIRVDVEETEDIRISLEKYKYLLYPNVINEIE